MFKEFNMRVWMMLFPLLYIGAAQAEEASQAPNTEALVANDEVQSGPLTATDKIVARFMALDLDESEGVSMQEYMTMVQARAEARFASMDRNHDGQISHKEYRNFWKSQKSQFYRLKR